MSSDPEDPTDECRVIDVDGRPVLVHGAGPLDATSQAFFAEVVRAAVRRHEAEHPDGDQRPDSQAGGN